MALVCALSGDHVGSVVSAHHINTFAVKAVFTKAAATRVLLTANKCFIAGRASIPFDLVMLVKKVSGTRARALNGSDERSVRTHSVRSAESTIFTI